jgi:hypothetical protein
MRRVKASNKLASAVTLVALLFGSAYYARADTLTFTLTGTGNFTFNLSSSACRGHYLVQQFQPFGPQLRSQGSPAR